MSKLNDTLPLVKLRGDVCIETADAKTGRVCQRAEGHNLFTSYALERFRKYCAAAIGCQFGANAYFMEFTSDVVSNDSKQYEFGILKHLYLTDNDAAITAASRQIPGNMTAYASRITYTGVDTKRGSINLNETVFTQNGLTAVFDFGTDKANGTHKSIFWSDQNLIDKYNMIELIAPHFSDGKRLARRYACFAETAENYFGTFGSTLYVIDKSTLAETKSYTLTKTPSNNAIFDVYNGICYFNCSTGDTVLNCFNLSDTTTVTKTLPQCNATYGGAVLAGHLYYPYNTSTVIDYDLSANTNVNKNINFGSYSKIIRSGADLYCITLNNVVYKYNPLSNTLTKLTIAYGFYEASNSLQTGKIFYPISWGAYYDSLNSIAINILCVQDLSLAPANMITGKVLDTPITKDNTQTMKVTYTITFS